MESSEYFLNVGFVFGNIIGINEDVVQVNDDNDVDHVREDVIHESLEGCRCISKPFRHYHPLERTIMGSEHSFPFIPSNKLHQMICMPEVDLGID